MDRPEAVGGSIKRVVVNHDQLAIPTQVKVQFQGIGPQLDRLFEGGHRVLGRERRRPAMGDVQSHGRHPNVDTEQDKG